MDSQEQTYVVYNPDGRMMMQTSISSRYDRESERILLDAGYTIKINGKRLTKKEVMHRD